MNWLYDLFFGSGIAHTVAMFAIAIAAGILLGKFKIRGITLGITWVLFVGIFLSHWGMRIEPETLGFIKEFGLILFVYSIGMQVGPGFFSAFKRGGIRLNMFAILIVVLGVITTLVVYWVTGTPITTMVGILSGAVTNTPGLGAAQQALEDMGGEDPTIAMGYAVAYPLGVIGIILIYTVLKAIFKVNYDRETEAAQNRAEEKMARATHISIEVSNPAIFGKKIKDVSHLLEKRFVISRILHADGSVDIGNAHTVLSAGDKLLVIVSRQDMDAVMTFIGRRIEMHRADWEKLDVQMVSRRIMVTQSGLNGRLLGEMHIQSAYGVNITRVNRAGLDLVAHPALALQIGDRVTVVGPETNIAGVEKLLGNSMRRLREPNLVTIFLGIFLGVALGSIPFAFPGVPQPVKLGLAGGPLIVAILVSRFGPTSFKLVTYTTASANLMLREIGICLFLAAVGLGAGEGFVDTVVNGGGLIWVWYGFIITVVPLFIVGVFARMVYKTNYFTLMGLIAGSTTDPPALAFSNEQTTTDLPAVAYSTVYPLVMFLRVLSAQLLIIFLA